MTTSDPYFPYSRRPEPNKSLRRHLWEKLSKNKLYTKPYNEFIKQFNTPTKIKILFYSLLTDNLIKYKNFEEFKNAYFGEPKYIGTSDFVGGREQLKANMALEQKFKEKYGDKNLWTKFAYINSDEELKDLLIENENKVDPYVLAGLISAEGLIDELYRAKKEHGIKKISDWYPPESRISGSQFLGLDDFYNRIKDFKKKGLSTLEEDKDYFPTNFEFYNEKGEKMESANFGSPRAAINAVSSYIKNIDNIINTSGIKVTPEEKEKLIYIGYNYGENGLMRFLKRGKTGSEVLKIIATEKPEVMKSVNKRVAVSNELRSVGGLEYY